MKRYYQHLYGLHDATFEEKMEWVAQLQQEILKYKALKALVDEMAQPTELLTEPLLSKKFELLEMLPPIRSSRK